MRRAAYATSAMVTIDAPRGDTIWMAAVSMQVGEFQPQHYFLSRRGDDFGALALVRIEAQRPCHPIAIGTYGNTEAIPPRRHWYLSKRGGECMDSALVIYERLWCFRHMDLIQTHARGVWPPPWYGFM